MVGKSMATEDDCTGSKDDKPSSSHFHSFNSEKRPKLELFHGAVLELSLWNIARGTKDPEIEFVTYLIDCKLGHKNKMQIR